MVSSDPADIALVAEWRAAVNRIVERTTIGQAQGVLMATLLCSADEAFEMMSEQSRLEHHDLNEVAAEIVERTIRRPTPPV